MDQDIIVTGLASAPIILALAEAIKRALPELPFPRVGSLISLGLAIGWMSIAKVSEIGGVETLNWGATVMQGVIVGLTSSGLYSAAAKPAIEAVAGKA